MCGICDGDDVIINNYPFLTEYVEFAFVGVDHFIKQREYD